MAEEGTYEYELMRAELLGVAAPDREAFEAARRERLEHEQAELEISQAAELATRAEQLQGTSGKLEELNSILSMTQRKINKFKTVCGSLTSLIKIRGSTTDLNASEDEGAAGDINTAIETLDTINARDGETDLQFTKRSVKEVGHKVSSQLDVLDSLINKAERAEGSMHDQNQQMKKFLK